MWKIVNGQWVELTEDEKQACAQEDQKYYKDFSVIQVRNAHIEIKARPNEQQQPIGWKAEISLGGKASYWTKVYIEHFPDLLVFLRDIESLDKIGL